MLAVSSLNTISSLISKALSDDYIPDEEYSLILLKFETFTRKKEDLREKSKISLETTGSIETEANELIRQINDYFSDEEYSLILLKFETFTHKKEDLREKSKISFETTGNIETEANELIRQNKIDVPT